MLTDLLDVLFGRTGRHEYEVTRPEPVLDEAKAKASAAAAITALVTIAGAAGVGASSLGALATILTVLAGAIIAIANAVLTLRAAYAARAQVTPVSDPVDATGAPLGQLTATTEDTTGDPLPPVGGLVPPTA